MTRSLTIDHLAVQEYEVITWIQLANENAGNLISVVQFLIAIYIRRVFFMPNLKYAYFSFRIRAMESRATLFYTYLQYRGFIIQYFMISAH